MGGYFNYINSRNRPVCFGLSEDTESNNSYISEMGSKDLKLKDILTGIKELDKYLKKISKVGYDKVIEKNDGLLRLVDRLADDPRIPDGVKNIILQAESIYINKLSSINDYIYIE